MRDLITEGRKLLAAATEGPWWRYVDLSHEIYPPIHDDAAAEVPAVASDVPESADAELIVWMRANLPALLDALEAAQRPPFGYEVVAKRPTGAGWAYTSAGSIWPELDPVVNHRGWCEDSAVADPERFGTGMEYIVVELREVQP